MTNNYYTNWVYAVYFYGNHEGCPDNWSNMHDERLEGLFENEEMAHEYIRGKAVKGHLVLRTEKDGTTYTVIGYTSDIEGLSELQKEACGIYDRPEYDDYGWRIERHCLYSVHEFDYSSLNEES